jgi:zinc D-Ala-D-Ala carboxypeptidase
LNSEKSLENSKDNLLQPLAKLAWQDLKSAAKADGIEIKVVSAYRSIERQRQLFLERLYSQGITLEQLKNGLGQDQIDMTLSLTAVPGYSRHHTGYTIDLACGDGLSFEDSVCNTWLAANNYEKAKFFGWIPSYPPDGGLQGPEPEAWEYVWVGTDVLHDD